MFSFVAGPVCTFPRVSLHQRMVMFSLYWIGEVLPVALIRRSARFSCHLVCMIGSYVKNTSTNGEGIIGEW
jgi:hypothetical protein